MKLIAFLSLLVLLTGPMNVFADSQCSMKAKNIKNAIYSEVFFDAKKATDCITDSDDIPYGSAPGKVIAYLGTPHHKERNQHSLEYYYKTGAGPYWFFFTDKKLAKKGLIWPERWPGTMRDLQAHWQERRHQRDWYRWSPIADK